MSRVRFQRNQNLVRFYTTGHYTLRSLGRLFKISHPRVIAILKRYERIGVQVNKKRKKK